MQPTLDEIIRDTTELIRRAGGRTGKVTVSPDVAELLEQLGLEPQPLGPVSSGAVSPVLPAHPDLESMAAEVAGCVLCGLSKTRKQTVFGVGNPHADLVFVGEAPGAEEDAQGIPFVGAAGQYLTRMIELGMGIPRDSVYICNVVKCRPPMNRDPSPEEKRLCEPYLMRQLDFIRPKVICALGKHAAQSLLRTEDSIGRLRGRWHEYNGIPLRVTYHPAYLLRSPEEKGKVWEDLKEIMKVLGLAIPTRKG